MDDIRRNILPFKADDYDYMISKYFGIDEEVIEDIIDNLSTQKIIKQAFFGDSLLNIYATMFLEAKYPDKNVYAWSIMRSILVCNKTLACMCNSLFYKDIKNTQHLNDHSKGTIFEAVIQRSWESDSDRIYKKLKMLFEFILNSDQVIREITLNVNNLIEESKPLKRLDIDPLFKDNGGLNNAINKIYENLEQDRKNHLILGKYKFLRQAEAEKILLLFSQKANDKVQIRVKETNINPAQLVHTGIFEEVSWTSRKGNSYSTKLYSCCGKSCLYYNSLNSICPRSKWKNPLSYHPGSLSVSSSRKSGGGIGPQGGCQDHIPHCKTSHWSCCRKINDEEGCKELRYQ